MWDGETARNHKGAHAGRRETTNAKYHAIEPLEHRNGESARVRATEKAHIHKCAQSGSRNGGKS